MNDYDTEFGVDLDTELPEGFWEELPIPLYWRLIVMPIAPKKKSKGGIVIPMEAQETQKYLNYMGKVVALGAIAGTSDKLGARGDGVSKAEGFPNVGDYVVYGRYSGQKMTYKGVSLLCINDDEILSVVPNPDVLQVHI